MAHQHYESHGKSRLPLIAEQLKSISDTLTSSGIVHWLDWGSLLGAYREGKQLDYDKDIDLGILDSDVEKVKEIFALKSDFFELCDWGDVVPFTRYFWKETPSQTFSYEYLYVDLYPYELVDGKYSSTILDIVGDVVRDMTSPVNISFEGFEFPCPGDTLSLLKLMFRAEDVTDKTISEVGNGHFPGLDVNYWSE